MFKFINKLKRKQSYIDALINTVKIMEHLKFKSDNVRSIDVTIGYLIKHNISFEYRGL